MLSNALEEVSLGDYEIKIKLISVVPSLDTGACSEQTKWFNEEVTKLDNVQAITVRMNLPFAQARWCGVEGVENIDFLLDHRDADFGQKYGVLVDELRLLTCSIFVADEDDKVTYVEYVFEVRSLLDYDAVLNHLAQ